MSQKLFKIGETAVAPGERVTISLPVPTHSQYMPMSMPVHVINGRRDGPVLFVCAAIHGDEINGIDIIRHLLRHPFKQLRGTLICIPIVNVYGFLTHTRYLPDRRDLNRSFPGSRHGSLASRLAYVFGEQIVSRATHGIDLHTGANNRINHPHIRANLDDEDTVELARAFGTPVIINANLRDGSLRQFAAEKDVKMLLYEAGEALRFNQLAVGAGERGILNVMRHLGMIRKRKKPDNKSMVLQARSSQWVRAPQGGIFRTEVSLGERVARGDRLGEVGDWIGHEALAVNSPVTGIVIGRTNLPVINEGDALFHIARFQDSSKVEAAIEEFHTEHIEGLEPGDYPDTAVY